MIIDNEQLIARLQVKMGLEPEQVEDQLNRLTNHILQAAEQGEPYEIEGFGVFKVNDGVLQFMPDKILKTEINNKYAGMKPIELIGAFKEPETGQMPDMTADSGKEDEVWSFDEDQASADEREASPEEEEQPERITATETNSLSLSEETFDKKPDGAESYQEPVLAGEEAQPPVDTGKDMDNNDDVVPEKSEKDPIGRFVTVAVSILLVGITGWFGYDFISGNNTMSNDRTLSSEANQQEQVSSQPVKGGQGDDDQVDDGPEEESSEPDELIQVINDEDVLSQLEQESTYGLQGTVNESINSWYTVVVHSLKDAEKAEDRKEQLEIEGYRVMINQVNLNGVMQYRVGVGQFSSIEEAQKAAGELSEPYKSNNFIKRF